MLAVDGKVCSFSARDYKVQLHLFVLLRKSCLIASLELSLRAEAIGQSTVNNSAYVKIVYAASQIECLQSGCRTFFAVAHQTFC